MLGRGKKNETLWQGKRIEVPRFLSVPLSLPVSPATSLQIHFNLCQGMQMCAHLHSTGFYSVDVAGYIHLFITKVKCWE